MMSNENRTLHMDNTTSWSEAAWLDPYNTTQETFPWMPHQIAIATFVCIVFVTSMVGNTLVVIVILNTRSLRRINNVLIVSLAAVDLTRTLLVLPMYIVLELVFPDPYPMDLCPVYHGLHISCELISIYNLTAISIERAFVINQPLIYHRIMTGFRIAIFVTLLWILGFTYGLLQILWFDVHAEHYALFHLQKQCEYTPSNSFAIVDNILCLVIPLCIMMGCYSKIFCVVQSQMNRIAPSLSTVFDQSDSITCQPDTLHPSSSISRTAARPRQVSNDSGLQTLVESFAENKSIAFSLGDQETKEGQMKLTVVENSRGSDEVKGEIVIHNLDKDHIASKMVDTSKGVTSSNATVSSAEPQVTNSAVLDKSIYKANRPNKVSLKPFSRRGSRISPEAIHKEILQEKEGCSATTDKSKQGSKIHTATVSTLHPPLQRNMRSMSNPEVKTLYSNEYPMLNLTPALKRTGGPRPKGSYHSSKRGSVTFKLDDEDESENEADLANHSAATRPDIPKLQVVTADGDTTCSSEPTTTDTSSSNHEHPYYVHRQRRHLRKNSTSHQNISSSSSTNIASNLTSASLTSLATSTSSRQRPRSRSLFKLTENKAIKLTALVIGTFVFCWMPYNITFLIKQFQPHLVNNITWDIVGALVFVSSALNPFIYNFYSSEFRRALVRIVTCKDKKNIPWA